MSRRVARVRRVLVLAGLGAVAPLPFLTFSSSAAPVVGSIYSYSFSGVTTASVPNGAESNSGVPLKLTGNWAASAMGVHFAGDTVSKRSVGYAKPASGTTLSAAASDAVGAGVIFRYEGPASGTCFKDSHNVTQIGRFGSGLSQLKIQLSSCSGTRAGVFVECRMVGANSTTSDLPKRGTQALVDGATYAVKCYKGPDPETGQATLTLKTTRLDSTAGSTATVDSFLITRPGAMRSTEYLSVANKYPMPAKYANNTDQFTGDVAKVAYCQTAALDSLTTCLDTEVPDV